MEDSQSASNSTDDTEMEDSQSASNSTDVTQAEKAQSDSKAIELTQQESDDSTQQVSQQAFDDSTQQVSRQASDDSTQQVSQQASDDSTQTLLTQSSFPSTRLLLSAILVALGGPYNYGYQLLITNPAQEAFLHFLNDSHHNGQARSLGRVELEARWSLIVSIFFWGSTAGAFLIGVSCEKFGRKGALQISHAVQVAACALTILSFYLTSAIVYSIARFLLGVSITLSLGIAPMFIAECSPKECRGITSMTSGLSLQVALVVGAIVAMPQLLGTTEDWWKVYAIELAITLLVMLLVPFIPESPEYLHKLGRMTECEKSIKFYHNIDGKAIEEVIWQFSSGNSEGQELGLLAVWKDQYGRRGTILGIVILVSMVMSGISAINAFSLDILLSTGFNIQQASIGNIIINIMNVVGTLSSSFVIDRLGRRILLLSTYGLLAVINATIAGFMFGFEYAQSSLFGYQLLVAICLFNLAFAAGPGPVSLFITAELVEQNARGAACTWANVAMCIARSLLTAIYFPLKNLIGQPMSYFLLFFPIMVVTVLLLYFFLPETKGKTASQVQEEWNNLPRMYHE